MNDYIVSCCSTADLSDEYQKELGVPYTCFSFTANGKSYKDDYGKTYPLDKFYDDVMNGMMCTTSQIGVGEYKEYFESLLKQGKDVLHLTLSSGISGSVNSARLAAEDLKDKYPNKVYVVDSLCASSGYGLLVTLVKQNKDNGMSIEDNYNWANENRTKIIHWFFSTDLTCYVRGGRISKASGLIGSALQICPLMLVTERGTLEVFEKIRTKKKAMKSMVEKMMEEVGPDYDGLCYMCNSACLEDAEEVKKMLLENFPKLKDVKIFSIGGVIGSHTGKGTVAVFYVGKKRAME